MLCSAMNALWIRVSPVVQGRGRGGGLEEPRITLGICSVPPAQPQDMEGVRVHTEEHICCRLVVPSLSSLPLSPLSSLPLSLLSPLSPSLSSLCIEPPIRDPLR